MISFVVNLSRLVIFGERKRFQSRGKRDASSTSAGRGLCTIKVEKFTLTTCGRLFYRPSNLWPRKAKHNNYKLSSTPDATNSSPALLNYTNWPQNSQTIQNTFMTTKFNYFIDIIH